MRDASLAAALLAGVPEAPHLAWKRLLPLVRRILRQRFGGTADEQDLCQEVFLRFFARITQLRNSGALRSFLIGICLGVAQNEIRRTQVRRRALGVVASMQGAPQPTAGAFDVDAREALGRLRDVLATVSAEERALFAHRHIDRLEVAQIAVKWGWSVPRTKRRLKRVTRTVGLRLRHEPALSDYTSKVSVAWTGLDPVLATAPRGLYRTG